MKSIKPINDFFRSETYAIVGISGKKKHFGNYVFKQLLQRNFSLVPVHRELKTFENIECHRSVSEVNSNAVNTAICKTEQQNDNRHPADNHTFAVQVVFEWHFGMFEFYKKACY